jgi:hypothetical protein
MIFQTISSENLKNKSKTLINKKEPEIYRLLKVYKGKN